MEIDQDTRIGADGKRHPIGDVDPDAPSVPYRYAPGDYTGDGQGDLLVHGPSGWETGPAGVRVTSTEPEDPATDLIWVDTTADPIVVKQYDGADWVTLEAP